MKPNGIQIQQMESDEIMYRVCKSTALFTLVCSFCEDQHIAHIERFLLAGASSSSTIEKKNAASSFSYLVHCCSLYRNKSSFFSFFPCLVVLV